jgi:hypothetical protein
MKPFLILDFLDEEIETAFEEQAIPYGEIEHTVMFGYLVLNSQKPHRELIGVDNDARKKSPLRMGEYRLPQELRGNTVLLVEQFTSGRYEGWYVGEMLTGMIHPLLLLPPEVVEITR